MHEILKRALDEALTAAYAGEISIGAEEVAFSEGFEREMRGLIRKTDRPIQKYIPILTAAACAVIAIGCAVLLPRLLSHSIPVEPSEESTTTVTSSVLTDEPAESTSTTETTPDTLGFVPPVPTPDEGNPNRGPDPDEFWDENPGAAGDVADGEVGGANGVPTATGSSAATVEPVHRDPNDFPAAGIIDDEENKSDDEDDAAEEEEEIDDEDDVIEEEEVADTTEEDTTVQDDNDWSGSDEEDTTVEDDNDWDESVEEDTTDEADDDWGGDDAADEDKATDDEDDDDDDMDYDDDETVDESKLPPIEKRASLNEEVRALLGCSLAESYLHNGNLMADGKFYDLPIIEGIDPETYRDPELAELIGAAKYMEDDPREMGLPLFWGNIGREAPVLRPVYESDRSDRNRYDELYFGVDSQVGDEEDEMFTTVETVYLEFFRGGIVRVCKDGYRGLACYRLDDEALERLTERIEARFKRNEPETVGELSEQIGSAADYARIYVGIRDYYDCTMYGAVSDGSFFAELLQKYKKEKLIEAEYRSGAPIQIAVVSRKSLREYNFMFYADGTVQLLGGKAFTVDRAELRAILSEYCRQKNLPAPVFYETLDEYLKDKNFTALTETMFYGAEAGGDIRLSGDSAEIRALIEEYSAKSAFLPDGKGVANAGWGSVTIRLEGWSPSVRISKDEIQIGYSRNIFKTPDGLYEKLCALLSEKGEAVPPPDESEDDDVTDDEEIVEDVDD